MNDAHGGPPSWEEHTAGTSCQECRIPPREHGCPALKCYVHIVDTGEYVGTKWYWGDQCRRSFGIQY